MIKYSDPMDLIFYSLSHPVRREILKLVRSKDYLVTELAKEFEVSLAAISKHIKVLEKAKMIRRNKSGRIHNISINEDGLFTAEQWIKEYQSFWNQQFDHLEDYFQKENKKK